MPEPLNQYEVMGFQGNFYVGPRGSENPSEMILADSVKDPSYTFSYSDVDATLRKHRGVKAYAKGLLDVEITFTLPNIKPYSADASLILNSLRSRRTPIAICMLDEEDGEGIIGDFEIFTGDKSEEGENIQEFSITAKPSSAGKPVKWINATTNP